jgi:hypothetical protein
MNRNLIAAALAAAILPAGAFDAAAAPGGASLLGKTYRLECGVNKSDGTALKIRIMVKNTSGHIIKAGTKIQLTIYGPGWRRTTTTQTAYRIVYVNDSIGFDQPKGARRCLATVKLVPDIQTKIKVPR